MINIEKIDGYEINENEFTIWDEDGQELTFLFDYETEWIPPVEQTYWEPGEPGGYIIESIDMPDEHRKQFEQILEDAIYSKLEDSEPPYRDEDDY